MKMMNMMKMMMNADDDDDDDDDYRDFSLDLTVVDWYCPFSCATENEATAAILILSKCYTPPASNRLNKEFIQSFNPKLPMSMEMT